MILDGSQVSVHGEDIPSVEDLPRPVELGGEATGALSRPSRQLVEKTKSQVHRLILCGATHEALMRAQRH